MKGKKGMVWSEISRWVIILLLIIVVLIIIGMMTGGMKNIWSGLEDLFTFG